MATIANQIKRISDSRDLLRSKGKALGLRVPAGNYWDDATNTYKAYTEAALTESDQIDKIAAAFNAVVPKLGTEIKVPITVTTDGTTTTVESYVLDTGFYANATIVPFIKVNTVDDIVINVEMVSDRELSVQSDVITPSAGFNYIGQFGYTIKDGAISPKSVSYDNTGVTVKVETSGWLDAGDTKKVIVLTSEMKSKVGNTETNLTSGTEITPDPLENTTLTITPGIYGSNRTLVIKPVSSQTQGDATVNDILSGKVAWVNGKKVTGEMPNYGGTETSELETAANSFKALDGKLAIKPKLGYYNDYSAITTTIVYNPTRKFNTTSITVGGTDTMSAQNYYETIPAGYYPSDIKRKITVQSYQGSVKIDYEGNKATFDVTRNGWIASDVTANITAGAATYAQTEADLEIESHSIVITPTKDANGKRTSYLTQVTVDNTVIYNLLSAI